MAFNVCIAAAVAEGTEETRDWTKVQHTEPQSFAREKLQPNRKVSRVDP